MLKRNKLTWIRWTVTYWFRNSFLLNEKCLYKNLKIFLMSWFFRIYQEFSRILEKFHFSISISRHFHFTFHSRNWLDTFLFHFSLLEMSEPDFHFTFHFSNFQYPLSQDTDDRISSIRVSAASVHQQHQRISSSISASAAASASAHQQHQCISNISNIGPFWSQTWGKLSIFRASFIDF